ncbi:MAG: HD domain-containing protein, partial [Betaproteobacteria bacterium]
FACLGHDLGKGTTPQDILPRHLGHEQRSVELVDAVCDRWKVPVECRELAEVVAREHGAVHRCAEFGAAALVRLLERCDALRRPDRFNELLLACECDARGRLGLEEVPYTQRERLLAALASARSVDTAKIAAEAAQRGKTGPAIGEAIHAARVHAVAAALAIS